MADGQDSRFAQRIVEISGEIDRVLVDICQQIKRWRGDAGFGVAHGRRWIAVHRAEVALPIHQHRAHGEILRQACHGFINSRVAVGVVFAQHFAYDTGGLLVGAVGADTHVIHGV